MGNGAGLMKSALFWMAMLTASFLLGFLVIAPLVHLFKSQTDASPAASAQQLNPAVRPPSNVQPNAAVAPKPRKLGVDPDDQITITPETTHDAAAVQSGDDPAHPGAARRADAPAATDDNTPARTDDRTLRTRDAGAVNDRPAQPADDTAPTRRTRRGAGDRRDAAEQPAATVDDSGRADQTPATDTPTRRRPRSGRTNTDTTGRRRSGDTGVQPGEGIDR